MKPVLLGTYGYHPSDLGQTSCYMLPELGIVLDAGTGLYRLGSYMQTSSIDIYLTHAHTDHTFGLGCLFSPFVQKELAESSHDEDIYSMMGRAAENSYQTRVHAVETVLTTIRTQFEMSNEAPRATWLPLTLREELPQNGVLTYFPVKHTIECYGFRLDWPNHSLAYVTDAVAEPGAPYIERIKGVDLLLHDCYLPNSLSELAAQVGHSYTTSVARAAAEAGVGRLILIHHNPLGLTISASEIQAAREIFPSIDVGVDTMELVF